MPHAADGIVELYRARDAVEAAIIRFRLEAAGVMSAIENEPTDRVLDSELAVNPRVLVRSEDIAIARDVLEHYLLDPLTGESIANAPSNCTVCGMSMTRGTICEDCALMHRSESDLDDCADPESEVDRNKLDNIAAEPASDVSLLEDSKAEAVASLPVMTKADLWWEVMAVLAIGVIPCLPGFWTFTYYTSSLPFWVDCISLTTVTGSVLYATLYLIHRSGEPWGRFGIERFRFSDLIFGLFLFITTWTFNVIWWNLTDGILPYTRTSYPLPATAFEYCLMFPMYGVAAMSEEVVNRGYLITRFEQLFHSRAAAVLTAAGIFATCHLYQGIQGAGSTFIFGVVYGLAFLSVRSVWPLAIGHAIYNIYVISHYIK